MKLATIEKIKEVFPHPNADNLEFVKVLGYRCIVPKGKWNVGDYCVLIQPDTVLPDVEWSQVYRSKSNRVKAIKLRGEMSFGIVEDLKILSEERYFIELALPEEGVDVTADLGIRKYEAPQPQELNAKGGLPFGISRTDEERWQNLDMSKYYGEIVDISLKADGQSFSAYYKDGQVGVCGRTMEYKLDCDNHFTRNFRKHDLENKLKLYCEKHGVNIALRGEQYGIGIQGNTNNPHSKLPVDVMFFSCWDIDNQRYFGPTESHYYRNVCNELNLPIVPIFKENAVFTGIEPEHYQTLNRLSNGDMFEGVVVVENDFSFKIINLNYDSKK